MIFFDDSKISCEINLINYLGTIKLINKVLIKFDER